mgnify:CR=1 FL=1
MKQGRHYKFRTETGFAIGFSLIELMVVIALISALAMFVVDRSARKVKSSLLDRALAQTLDYKRAALNVQVSSGQWPDSINQCNGAGAVLAPLMGELQANPWGEAPRFSCLNLELSVNATTNADTAFEPSLVTDPDLARASVQPSFIIEQLVPTQALAQRLRLRLPASEVRTRGEGFSVATYVPMVVLPRIEQFNAQLEVRNRALVYQPIECGAGTAQIALLPQSVCSVDGGEALYGYRIFTRQIRSRGTREIVFQVRAADGSWHNGLGACDDIPINEQISAFQYCELGLAQ